MQDDLRITTVQSNLAWEDIDENLKSFTAKLKGVAKNTDIVILPEMFTTGFSMNAKALAEEADGKTLQWLKLEAKTLQAMVIGSYIVMEGGYYYNRLILMQPDGKFLFYDKRHLFALGGEHLNYTQGQKQVTVSWKGWKLRPLICYDLRFPVWSRNTSRYDLLVYIASWPDTRSAHWRQLLIARAIENQSYVVGVNRVGIDGNGLKHQGDSMLIDYSGNVLHHAQDQEDVATIEISKSQLDEYRSTLPFLRDRDDFIMM